MADVFQAFNTTVAAGVTTVAPTVVPIVTSANWNVVKVSIVIPAGHAGLTGIQLWYGGGPAIPYQSGWYSGDDDVIPLELSNAFPAGVPWSVAMINNDVISHAFQTRWEMDLMPITATSPPAVSAADIYAAADGGGVSA